MMRSELDFCVQQSDVTFRMASGFQVVEVGHLEQIKLYMTDADMEIFRLCLHQSEEERIQSMVLFFRKGFVMDYLWQDHGFVQYNIIEGEALFSTLDGTQETSVTLTPSTPVIRFPSSVIRRTIAKSEFFIFSETQYGPFRKDNTKRLVPTDISQAE